MASIWFAKSSSLVSCIFLVFLFFFDKFLEYYSCLGLCCQQFVQISTFIVFFPPQIWDPISRKEFPLEKNAANAKKSEVDSVKRLWDAGT